MMALFHKPAPVDYKAQQGEFDPSVCLFVSDLNIDAFENFLSTFKSSSAATEAAAANALAGLNIEDDEYDFMDDALDSKRKGRRTSRSDPSDSGRRKYVEMLQNVANRETSEISIELDDLDTVRCNSSWQLGLLIYASVAVRKISG